MTLLDLFRMESHPSKVQHLTKFPSIRMTPDELHPLLRKQLAYLEVIPKVLLQVDYRKGCCGKFFIPLGSRLLHRLRPHNQTESTCQ